MRAMVLANSPLQVIGAWEFQRFLPHHYGIDEPKFELVLVPTGSDRSIRQTRETAARLGLSFRILGENGSSSARVRSLFSSVRTDVARLRAGDVLAIGNPAYDLYADAAARASPAHVWVLDDGVVNWRYIEATVTGERLPRVFAEHPVRRLLKRLLVGRIRAPVAEDLRWFSLFARYLTVHDRVHQNSLYRLRERSSVSGGAGGVVFLGSPMVAAGILTAPDYLSLCRSASAAVAEWYPHQRQVYIRHRAEREWDDLASCFDDIEDSTGPIELRWLDDSTPPLAVIGILSSALFTLAELLRGTSEVIALWPGDGLTLLERREHVEGLRTLFEKSHSEGSIRLETVCRR